MKHQLVDGTLKTERGGITARCECGWVSAGHFSSFAASVAFQGHQEANAGWCPFCKKAHVGGDTCMGHHP